MDFGKILTRAWEITWRWKVLWILGFLAALGGGGGGGGFGNSGYRFGNQNPNPSSGIPNFNLPSIPPALMGLIVGLACLAVLIGIALWVLSVMARGGLIAGVVQAEDEGSVSLGRAWAVGQRRFWTLFGIDILVAIPILVLVLLAIGGAVVTLIPAFSTTGSGGGPNAGQGALIVGVVLCACLFICGITLVAAVLGQIRIYAERAAVLEGMRWTAAFGRGWQVIREHLGPTLILWLIFLGLGIVVGIVILIILSPLLIPIVAMTARGEPSAGWLLALCGGGLITLVISAVIGSIVQVFTSASWTLAYRELTGTAPARPAGGFAGPEEPGGMMGTVGPVEPEAPQGTEGTAGTGEPETPGGPEVG